jgi:hypothetical protein
MTKTEHCGVVQRHLDADLIRVEIADRFVPHGEELFVTVRPVVTSSWQTRRPFGVSRAKRSSRKRGTVW